MANWIFTVSEVNEYIRRIISAEDLLQDIKIRGEISGYRKASSGHIYLTIKDAGAQLQCVYFRQDQPLAMPSFTNGMQVIATGRMAYYAANGQINFYIKSLENSGIGGLYILLEQLKQRLNAEGYFDREHKKLLPERPRTLGVVTSEQGAVIHDIIRIARRRDPHINILLYPVKVQGEGAGEEIAAGIQALNARLDVDVLIVGRGGGSFEDLFEFNSESVVKAIYHSRIPVISAVGHEVDHTLADLVADQRAATPSEAAELAIPNVRDFLLQLDDSMDFILQAAEEQIQRKENEIKWAEQSLRIHDPEEKLNQYELTLDVLNARLDQVASHRMIGFEQRLQGLEGRLSALEPGNVLKRGFALVYSVEQALYISGAGMLHKSDGVVIHFHDGQVNAQIGESNDRSNDVL